MVAEDSVADAGRSLHKQECQAAVRKALSQAETRAAELARQCSQVRTAE
jgi:hypothetical protein